MAISGLLRRFVIYKEFRFSFHPVVYKSSICAPKLYASKIDKTVSALLSNITWEGTFLN